jgi:hypothetical protein
VAVHGRVDPAAGEYMDADIAVAGQLYAVTGNLLHRMFASKMIQGCCCYITVHLATIVSHSRASYIMVVLMRERGCIMVFHIFWNYTQ